MSEEKKSYDFGSMVGSGPDRDSSATEPDGTEDETRDNSSSNTSSGKTEEKTPKLEPIASVDEPKKKPGYYVRRSIDDRLDQLVSEMAYKLSLKGHSISKSELAECAIDLMLRDWESNGVDGLTAAWMLTRSEQKK